jgi:two-component system, OmpR family, heavy metal sensor histidine kinase CusS
MIWHASIRLRLTLWYGAVLATILVAFSASVYLLMRHNLLALTDAGLAEELSELADEIGTVTSPGSIGPRYAQQAQHEGYEFQVTSPDGRVLFRSDRLGAGSLPTAGPGPGQEETNYTSLRLDGLGKLRVATRRVSLPSGTYWLQVGTSLGSFDDALRKLLTIFLITGPLAVGGTLWVGYLLARKALAPVDRMVAAAAEITATRLDRRLDVPPTHDELARLAETFNGMFERLEGSFGRIRRFTADAAHELRTPLTVIRTSSEVALRSPRSPEGDRRVLEDIVDEADRLGRLVAQLLFLCREDDGGGGARREDVVALDDVAREVADLMQAPASDKSVSLCVEDLDPCVVRGDGDRLRQLVINLIDNAVKYTPPGGRVTVRGELDRGHVRVEVMDTGCGIPEEHLKQVFDRFYRIDSSRSRATEGTGLGLAICRSIVEGHHGRIWIQSEVGRGTRAIFELPRCLDTLPVCPVGMEPAQCCG